MAVEDPEERRARAALMSMQERITRGPHSALNVPLNATPAEIRAAFLSLTKQYHPARFGRMSTEVQRLSNEIFLGIRAAHDGLARAAGARPGAPGSPGSSRGSGGSPPLSPATRTRNTPASGTPVAPTPTSSTITRPLPGRPGTTRTLTPTSTPIAAPPSPPAGTAAAPPGPIGQRSTGSVAALRSGTAPGLPATRRPDSRSTAPANQPIPGTNTAGQPATRAPIAATSPSSRATGGVPALRPSGGGAGGTPVAPLATGATGAHAAVLPATSPAGSTQAVQSADQKDAQTALDLLRRSHWATARQLLQALTGRVPGSRYYRALLAYARGREALAAGRVDEAHAELQRALELDPGLELARAALAEHWSINFHKK